MGNSGSSVREIDPKLTPPIIINNNDLNLIEVFENYKYYNIAFILIILSILFFRFYLKFKKK